MIRPNSFHTCYGCRQHWLLPFYTTFFDFDLAWGAQSQCKAKPIRFVFLHTLISSDQCSRERTLFMWFRCRNFNVNLYSDIYGPISFKLRMIETTKVYIVISVWMTMTFIQGHSWTRNQKRLCPYSCKFWYWFWWNSVCGVDLLVCWSSC